jgi:hypothetical protein
MHHPAAPSQTLKTARRLLTPVLLVCLSAAVAEAGPHARRHVATRHPGLSGPVPPAQVHASCGPYLTLRTLQRQSRAIAGPVARTTRSARALQRGLPLPKPLLKRGVAVQAGDDDAAIANDAPAASFGDERGEPSLRPLGFLVSSIVRLPPSSPVALHASRGPPPHA